MERCRRLLAVNRSLGEQLSSKHLDPLHEELQGLETEIAELRRTESDLDAVRADRQAAAPGYQLYNNSCSLCYLPQDNPPATDTMWGLRCRCPAVQRAA